MFKSDDPYGVQYRKKKLDEHLLKFNKLKEEGKWKEAMKQLNITLQYAGETLEYSMTILSQTLEKIGKMDQTEQERIQKAIQSIIIKFFPDKNVILPEKNQVH